MFATPCARVTLESEGRVIRLERTAERLTVESLDALLRLMGDHLPVAHRGRQGLLIDARPAPMLSNDDLRPGLERMHEGFRRSAVVVSTAVGRLQASRVTTSQGAREARILVNDEAEALAFLLG